MEIVQDNLDSLIARARKKHKRDELDDEFDCLIDEEVDIEVEFPEFEEELEELD